MAYPAEMLPLTMLLWRHRLPPCARRDRQEQRRHRAWTIHPIPAGYNRIYLLAAAAGGDQHAVFAVGNHSTTVTVQDWSGFLGQWDTRVWSRNETRDWATSAHHQPWVLDKQREDPEPSPRFPTDYLGLRQGYVKPADVAWYASHHHTAAGLNEPYQYSYLFAYALDLPAGATTLTLPDNPAIRIFAVTVAQENPTVTPAQPLHDTLAHTAATTTLEPAP